MTASKSDISGEWIKLSPLYPNHQTIVFVITATGETHLARVSRLGCERYDFHLFNTSGHRVILPESVIYYFMPISITMPFREDDEVSG